jgi:hypothetical protein
MSQVLVKIRRSIHEVAGEHRQRLAGRVHLALYEWANNTLLTIQGIQRSAMLRV